MKLFHINRGVGMSVLFRFFWVCVFSLNPQIAFSQEEAKEEDLEELPVYAAEEIVVTESKEKAATISTVATKVPVPLRLTPASIGVVNNGLFRNQSGVVLGDALRNVSGVNVQTVFGVTDFFIIRGFDSLSSGLVLTDGASEPEATFYNLYNLERVEVLKGPGAFLYGGNPLSGSVNLSRKQPQYKNMFHVTGSYGPYNTGRGTVDAGWADLNRGTAVRFNGLRQVSDNYRDDKSSGIWAVNPSATWRSEKTSVTANFEVVTSAYKSDSGLPVVNGAVASVPRTRSYQSPFDVSDQEIYRARADLHTQLSPKVTLRNKLYYTDFSWVSQGTLYNGMFPNAQGGSDVIRTLVLLDDRQKALGNQFEMLFSGATASVEHTFLAGLELTQWKDIFSLDVAVLPSIDLINPVETAAQPHFIIPGQSQGANSKSIVIAPYVVDRLVFSESVQAFLGARFDRIDYDDPLTSTSRKYNKLSPMVGLVLVPTEELSFYANVGKAFAPPSSQVSGPREAEESKQFEIGAKRYMADNKLHASVAFYHLQKDNIGIPDATGVTKQDGDQQSRGVELEMMVHPRPDWHTFFSYAFSKAELTRFSEFVPVPTATGVSYQFLDRSGNRPAFSPRHILNVWSTKGFENGLVLGAGARYVSEQFIAEDNQFEIRGVLTFDASVSYAYNRMNFRMNAKNLTDQTYDTRGFGSTSVIPAPPFGLYCAFEINLQ
jgi:TonB-dependent siderophore receptor